MDRISVIIPTRNRKELLLQTLGNLFDQSRVPDEIIVIDDSSTDGTVDALSVNYPSVKVLDCKGSGPGAARNAGFRASSGDLIKFMDSDDLLTLNSIEDQATQLRSSSRSAVYNAYFKASFQSDRWIQEDVIMHFDPLPTKVNLKKWILKGFFIPIPTFMFRRELLEQTGTWNEELTAYEDFEYFWRLAGISQDFMHSSRSAMLYRIHGRQTTESNVTVMEREKDKIQSLKTVIDLAEKEISLNRFEKEYLKVQLRHALAYTSDNDHKALGSWLNKLAEIYLRVEKKIGRLKTKTDWPPIYGPSNSKEVFQQYIKGLKVIQDLK